MEQAEKLLNDLIEIVKTVGDTQSSQTRVIDKLSDGLLRAANVVGELKTRVEILEAQIKTITSGGM